MTLTQRDLDEIEKIIEEKLDNKIKFIPSKKEFFSAMDKIMGELQEIRDELTITGNQTTDHETRVSALEELHPKGKHIFI